MENLITIQYIYNSTFTIEYKDYFIVIDYFKGDLVLPKDKKIIFIVTHSHEDHYSPAIFTYPGAENALYVLSDDVEEMEHFDNVTVLSKTPKETENKKHAHGNKVYRTHPDDKFEFGGLKFQTFGSTDKGISIYFTMHDVAFFHAGDLNAWKWPSFSKEEQQQEIDDYMKEINKIKKLPIDIGFGVVDGRLKENAFVGGDIYLKELKPQIFIPMHFRENFDVTKKFAERNTNPNIRVQAIESEGERILVRG